jgi:hypothetical protein
MATCTVIPGRGGFNSGAVRDGQTSARGTAFYLDPDEMRQPQYTVYLHTISKRAHEQPNPVYGNVIIPACPKEKRSINFMKITHPVAQWMVNPDNVSGPLVPKYCNATGLALSICNPSHVGNDLAAQDNALPDWARISSGECDLGRQGVFASLNEVPTEEELRKAEARRLAYYKFRFEEANGLLRSNPRQLQEILILDHHMAAEMFGVDVEWHRVMTPKIECPQCGEKIKESLAFHYVNGVKCVLDWERAYLAGAVKKDEVPEGREWWTVEDKPKRKTGISAAARDFSKEV